ncbi:hypothetical protein B0H66DRAFT_594521 [Apodospora peruviana]|uniref:Peroxisomal short-chain alcohol dehydrogenase n=1 Tax=Apodospora peruviana TaxID=516989 RepID=A0AAE0M0H8_9PEZI|nr:hypothetical protein B0H66DRAFT_594521 [Apodospora peruviana]
MAPIPSHTLTVPFIKTLHKSPYPAISTTRPELSQAGRTVLVTGGGSGIGLAIARGFMQASAARVIIIGRRENVITEAASELNAEAKAIGSPTSIIGRSVDASDPVASERLWTELKNNGIAVDVLVLCAAAVGALKPILDMSLDEAWKPFEINVRHFVDFSQRFGKQGDESKKKYIVNVSSSAVHRFWTDAHMFPMYATTKNAGTLVMQQIAKDTDADKIQIVSFHPGSILTEAAKDAGIPDDVYDWDDVALPGQFAVWTATEDAKFLHGRWVAAHWDIDEIKAPGFVKKVESERNYLRIGLVGIEEPL